MLKSKQPSDLWTKIVVPTSIQRNTTAWWRVSASPAVPTTLSTTYTPIKQRPWWFKFTETARLRAPPLKTYSVILSPKESRHRTSISRTTTTCFRPASSLPDIDIDSLSMKFKNQNHLSEASPSAVYQETSSLSGPCHLSRNARQFHQWFIHNQVKTQRFQT